MLIIVATDRLAAGTSDGGSMDLMTTPGLGTLKDKGIGIADQPDLLLDEKKDKKKRKRRRGKGTDKSPKRRDVRRGDPA